jgi:endonuclease III
MAMTNETRRELLRVLDELSAQCPDVRFGQLLANLATLAKGPTVEAIWDAEDEELLQAARRQLEIFRARHTAVAS